MGIQNCSNKGAGPFWGPIMGKIKNFFRNIQKSSHEPLVGMNWYLVWNILGARRFQFVQMKSLGSQMAPPQGLTFLHGEKREILKKSSSREQLHQIGQYLAWNIPRTKRFNFVQIKSLVSQMALPQGPKVLHSDM